MDPKGELPLWKFRPTHPAPYGHEVPSAPGSATSRAAADAIEERHGKLVAQVYRLVVHAGPHGLTREEIGLALQRPTSDVCSPVRWLYLRGYIGPEGTRPTTRGNEAEVMKLHLYVTRWHGTETRAQRVTREHLTAHLTAPDMG